MSTQSSFGFGTSSPGGGGPGQNGPPSSVSPGLSGQARPAGFDWVPPPGDSAVQQARLHSGTTEMTLGAENAPRMLVCSQPICQTGPYLQVSVDSLDTLRVHGVGQSLPAVVLGLVHRASLGPAPPGMPGYPFTVPLSLPGWHVPSPMGTGYHSDDGNVWAGEPQPMFRALPWNMEGAVAGVGIAPGPDRHTVGFTRGREGAYSTTFDARSAPLDQLYFAVGLYCPCKPSPAVVGFTPLIRVTVNFSDHGAFVYPVRRPLVIAAPDAPAPQAPPPRSAPAPSQAAPAPPAALDQRLLDLLTRDDASGYDDTPSLEGVTLALRRAMDTVEGRKKALAREVLEAVAGLHRDAGLHARLRTLGLVIQTVSWEDTSRYKGSCWGGNISDMTLVVGGRRMPMIRRPNFADVTADIDAKYFTLMVGNEQRLEPTATFGQFRVALPPGAPIPLTRVTLEHYLTHIGRYIQHPGVRSLWRPRDAKILTSTQACILPLRDGKVEFGVGVYNYQSTREPAVLVIVASAQGTSAQVVLGRDNILYFNKAGLKASFLAQRLADDRAARGVPTTGPMTVEEARKNHLLILQVPLKVRSAVSSFPDMMSVPSAPFGFSFGVAGAGTEGGGMLAFPAGTYSGLATGRSASAAAGFSFSVPAPGATGFASSGSAAPMERSAGPMVAPDSRRGMDDTQLSTGEGTGPYPTLRQFTLERDEEAPIRATIQYYKVTDSPVIDDGTLNDIAVSLTRVYSMARGVGDVSSLVDGGHTGRATETWGGGGGPGPAPGPDPTSGVGF